MGINYKTAEIISEFTNRGLFKECDSVLDMGDMDLNLNFDQIKTLCETYNLKFDASLFNRSKHFPERPRVSSSMFWKTIGLNTCERMDINAIKRDDNDKTNVIIKDLNFPLDQQNLYNKYNIVTDFGNNEHPFNIVEAYKTMHKVCKKNGYLIVQQALMGGNGFYQFDHCTIDSIAAVNSYSIIFSCFLINKDNEIFSTQLDKKVLKILNLNEIKNIYMMYILKKNNSEDFKFPYQGRGKQLDVKELYSLKTIFKSQNSEDIHLPTNNESITNKNLIKIFFKRILKKLKINFK